MARTIQCGGEYGSSNMLAGIYQRTQAVAALMNGPPSRRSMLYHVISKRAPGGGSGVRARREKDTTAGRARLRREEPWFIARIYTSISAPRHRRLHRRRRRAKHAASVRGSEMTPEEQRRLPLPLLMRCRRECRSRAMTLLRLIAPRVTEPRDESRQCRQHAAFFMRDMPFFFFYCYADKDSVIQAQDIGCLSPPLPVTRAASICRAPPS